MDLEKLEFDGRSGGVLKSYIYNADIVLAMSVFEKERT